MSMTTEEAPSIRALIENLDVGETFARAQRFDPDEVTKDTPPIAMRSVRLSVQGTAHRISERTGNRYTIESGEFRTASRDIMAVVCVTRTE